MKKKLILLGVFSGLLMLLLTAGGFVAETLSRLDLDRIRALPQSTAVFDGEGKQAALLSGAQNRVVVPLSEISAETRNAFLAAEDARFYRHRGIDVVRIGGAILQNIKRRGFSQGASTITQQLVKLTHLTGEKTLLRKAREAILALRLETLWSKDEILEAYLNTVYFGAGAYGVEAAATTYFGVSAAALTTPQSAVLAGIIKSPSKYAPHRNPENALSRRNLVLDAMADSGFIDSAASETYKNAPLDLKIQAEKATALSFYTQRAAEEACRILALDYEDLLSGGYRLYTGLDQGLQNAAHKLYREKTYFPPDAKDSVPVESALVCANVQNGELLCVIGGRRYQTERGLNRANAIRRQPGSAFKPISVYAAAVDRFGFLPTSFVDDTRRDFGNGYRPGNSGDKYYGPVTLREALARSLNAATLDLVSKIGILSAREYALSAGIALSPADNNLSLALGSLTNGVSPENLNGAYAMLAGGGLYSAPHTIRKIESSAGEILYRNSESPRRALSKTGACMVTDMLKSAAEWGSARALSKLPFEVAGKTGTVGDIEGGNRDVWTSAFTPKLAVTVWMGFDKPDKSHTLPDEVTGSSHPAKLIAEFLRLAGKKADGGAFDLTPELTRVLIDRRALTRLHKPMLAGEYTPKSETIAELFPASHLPTEISDVWKRPSAVFDLQARATQAGIEISFTAVDDFARYLVLRDGLEIAALSGATGETLTCLDPVGGGGSSYQVLPLHKELFGEAIRLEGAPSAKVVLGLESEAAKQPGEEGPLSSEAPLF